jgi:predicted RNase H-like nuclease (RuvC/YqgF family)
MGKKKELKKKVKELKKTIDMLEERLKQYDLAVNKLKDIKAPQSDL